jgi:hypothetical protein
LLAVAQPRPPQQPQPAIQAPAANGKLVRDDWDIAYLDGFRVGYTRLKVEEMALPNGTKFYRASRELSLTVRRGPDLARIQFQGGTDELANGQVLGVFMQQGLGAQVQQTLQGTVQGNQLNVTAKGGSNFNKPIPWNPAVVGTLGEVNLLKTRKPKPGDRFDYLIYEPLINAIVTVRVSVEAFEQVAIGSQMHRLLRVSAVPDEIAGVQLPSQILYLDDNLEVRRSYTSMEGFGFLVIDRSTEAEAKKPVDPNQLPNPMERQTIKLRQRLSQPYGLQSITYRVTLTNDREPVKAFADDGRQTVRPVQGKNQTIDVQVQALRTPPTAAPVKAANPGPEFLESNFFITSDDERVKQHAKIAVAGETDPWRKAQRIEKWVHDNMKVQNFSEAMAPASEVARTLTGDCTEFSMLAAAMCRTAGVPSRTAIGLLYVDQAPPRPQFLGFHMWTEVYVRGAWVAIDATLGQGSVGPTHLKITDASWHDTRSMKPLLPIMRVMIAKPAVEIVVAMCESGRLRLRAPAKPQAASIASRRSVVYIVCTRASARKP